MALRSSAVNTSPSAFNAYLKRRTTLRRSVTWRFLDVNFAMRLFAENPARQLQAAWTGAVSRLPGKKAALRPGMVKKDVTSWSRRGTFLIFIIHRKHTG